VPRQLHAPRSANRCTEISFFSRSTSDSGFAPLNLLCKKPSRTILRILHFLYRSRVYTIACILAADQGEQKMHLTISPVMPAKKLRRTHSANASSLSGKRAPHSGPACQGYGHDQRTISYYEIEADSRLPRRSSRLPRFLRSLPTNCSAYSPPRPQDESAREQRLWKRFQRMATLPTKDQRAVIRLINSLAGSTAHSTPRQDEIEPLRKRVAPVLVRTEKKTFFSSLGTTRSAGVSQADANSAGFTMLDGTRTTGKRRPSDVVSHV